MSSKIEVQGSWWSHGYGRWDFYADLTRLGSVWNAGDGWHGVLSTARPQRIGPFKTMKAAVAALEKELNK